MRSEIRSFKDLDVWMVAMELAVACYELVKRLPMTERFELCAQIRRAAVSVPANIAEGHAAGQTRRFLFHARIALGSLGELETELELAHRLGMLAPNDLERVLDRIDRTGKLLHGLTRALRLKLLKSAATCLAFLGVLPAGYLLLSGLV